MSGVYLILIVVYLMAVPESVVDFKDVIVGIALLIGDLRHFGFTVFRQDTVKFMGLFNTELKKLKKGEVG